MKDIYIQTVPTEKWAVVMEESKIDLVSVSRQDDEDLVGNIYIGRVVNIEPSLQAAFVHFGPSKLGFLKCSEIPDSRQNPEKRIEQLIHEGQALWVQVTKDAIEDKGAQLTANVTLPGQDIVYLPFGQYHAVSKKIEEDRRNELMELASGWSEGKEGVLFRTSAKHVSDTRLLESCGRLKQEWKEIETALQNRKPPALAFEDPVIPDQIVRQYGENEVQSITVDEQWVKRHIDHRYPHLASKCEWKDSTHQKPFTIDQVIEKVIERNVPLQGGAEIVVDQTEAMVVIDVNSAKKVGKTSKSQSVLQTNVAAAKEVAKQIRLRNLSGMILIDFITMKNPKDQQKVITALKKELKQDPVRSEVLGFTKLGLLEMTRKRTSSSLSYRIAEKRPDHVLTLETKVYQLERELLSYRRSDKEVIVLEVDPELLSLFREKIDIEKIKSFLYKEVYVLNNSKSDSSYRIRYVGDEKNLQERPFYIDGSLDRLF
ncbi:Rne/Rng family ribonuclease [Pontibacillus sp. ALD_SL1]|uniref:Rne/Rng family ribonuclease n=1 Tax=Pontibacillus sp. ALD_SL1 TaxID=2777185 RepID=UPI001A976DB7|nr:Rne/Rng family ribonuclease [Pontibacillus sp. ALD_SL1]QSS99098.1 Rne/Rng family ribonuclease [Pontibacillus sp. ALD_SL1]